MPLKQLTAYHVEWFSFYESEVYYFSIGSELQVYFEVHYCESTWSRYITHSSVGHMHVHHVPTINPVNEKPKG